MEDHYTEHKIYTPIAIIQAGGKREIIDKERDWLLGGYDLEWKIWDDHDGNLVLARR